jgi:hypothetical protein
MCAVTISASYHNDKEAYLSLNSENDLPAFFVSKKTANGGHSILRNP